MVNRLQGAGSNVATEPEEATTLTTASSSAPSSKEASPPRDPSAATPAGTTTDKKGAGGGIDHSEWELVGRAPTADTTVMMSSSDSIAGDTPPAPPPAAEDRADANTGGGESSVDALSEPSPADSAETDAAAAETDTEVVCANKETEGKDARPTPGSAAASQTLSLAERQRLQRESQLAFLRSRGILNEGGSAKTNNNNNNNTDAAGGGCAGSGGGGGGAGAISPAAREGFVAHRDVSGRIANLRNAVQTKTSAVGASMSMSISRSGSNVSAGGENVTAEEEGTSTTTATTTAGGAVVRGKDDAPSTDTSYPPFPAYPQTMIGLGFRLGDPRDKKGGSGGSGNANANGSKRSTTDLDEAMASMLKGARKAGVAVTGGAMVAVGAVLTPLPTPGGILLAGAGLGVLSTEFEGARKVMDKGRDRLVDLIDSMDDDRGKNEEKDAKVGDGDAVAGGECGDAGERKGSDDAGADAKAEGDDDGSAETEDFEARSNGATASASCSRRTSDPSSKDMGEVASSQTNAPSSNTSSSIRSGLSRIGKSIRPLLTDDEAPRRAMDELKTKSERRMSEMKSSTQRTYHKMRSHLNTVVDQLALPDDEALGYHDFAASLDGGAGSVSAAASTASVETEAETGGTATSQTNEQGEDSEDMSSSAIAAKDETAR